MHQFLIDEEEERCRALEAEYALSEETKGKAVKRKQIAKPWKRPGENALCQDSDLLIIVHEYDYDLSDSGFQGYCLARGVLHVAGKMGSKRWRYFANHNKKKDEFLSDPYFQYAEEVNGKSYKYAADEMEADWKTILIGRASFQDCWELYAKRASK
jgi:hypothetical protein